MGNQASQHQYHRPEADGGCFHYAIPRRATYKPVHADADMENLLDRAINQNYVPVIDDKGSFIGIITRKEIIKYCYKEMKELSALRAQMEEAE